MSPTVPPEAPADPVAAKERDDALEQSARRAAGLVVEARAERQAQHDRAVQDLIAQLLAHGLPEYFQIGAGDFSEENDRIRARTGPYPAFTSRASGKPIVPAFGGTSPLKFEHEQVHPPFSHPEFIGDPRNRWSDNDGWHGHVWGGSGSQQVLDLTNTVASWGGVFVCFPEARVTAYCGTPGAMGDPFSTPASSIFSESRGSWRVALLSPPPFHELEERPLNTELLEPVFKPVEGCLPVSNQNTGSAGHHSAPTGLATAIHCLILHTCPAPRTSGDFGGAVVLRLSKEMGDYNGFALPGMGDQTPPLLSIFGGLAVAISHESGRERSMALSDLTDHMIKRVPNRD
ncbi:hypothetical protein B0H14DRAFT_3496584 [Mycena olivaceomarginata]|nr:hypothetical protein B0H14DRAFT_3496584 [Mycena olivaceomarginata]